MKPTMVLACLILGAPALCACTHTVDCSGGVYRSDCLPGTVIPDAASPAPARPAVVPSAVSARPPAGPGMVSYGDPGQFADVDDKQCRSYGLTFGSRDYADCRIRLSAQHRGLDPNVGTTGPGSR
jgi:hypothetical protein